ncbi:energy transducer TonB [Neptunicella marina]|uniref:Protein TonB n=1 Tax=Neptunicella marina TaxID=2125989 RepID=A0A8J6M0I6_9ALTE|nr:energy transducer TonB [Neptunicella marina]MBC3764813.1 energy transducer TonB [Neptunicella marina]
MSRVLVAFVLAAGITLGLFYLMQALIQSGGGEDMKAPEGNVLEFIRLKQEDTVQKKDRKPKKPPKPADPPPQMEQPQMDSPSPDASNAGMSFSADVASDVSLEGGISLDSADGEYLPIVKVAPVYPRRALQRGIEGYVIVEFTVTKAGTVKDPIVIEANPEGMFEQAAIDAALKFKYKPRVVNGEETAVSGVQNRITFKMNG